MSRIIGSIEWVNATPAVAAFVNENPGVLLTSLLISHSANACPSPIQGILVARFETVKLPDPSQIQLNIHWGNYMGFYRVESCHCTAKSFDAKLLRGLEGLKSSRFGQLKLSFSSILM